jgi:hypothetical protein
MCIASPDNVTLVGQIRRHLIACLLQLSRLAQGEGLWAEWSGHHTSAVHSRAPAARHGWVLSAE